jgi:hypothetical protein
LIASLSLCKISVQGAWGGIPSLGTIEDAFGRSPDAGNSFYVGHFVVWEPGMGTRLPVTLTDESGRSIVVEYLSRRDSTTGT